MDSIQTAGVTVGVGDQYAAIAHIAAMCFSESTGLPAVVLGNEEFAASGLPHPAALKLQAFDYVDAQRVVYFDADWLCLSDWDVPYAADDATVLGCRDFILQDEWPRQKYAFDSPAFVDPPDAEIAPDVPLRSDYIQDVRQFAQLRTPPAKWMNTGLLILNRLCHTRMLSLALELYLSTVGHHPMYYEQPAMMKALEYAELDWQLLPRKLNVLAAHQRKWPLAVVGLHVKLKRHSAFMCDIKSGRISNRKDARAYFLA